MRVLMWMTLAWASMVMPLPVLAQDGASLVQPSPFTWQGSVSTATLSVTAVGDVLLHEPLHRQALTQTTGHQSLWPAVAPLFHQADMAYANLEGPVAPGTVAGGRDAPDPGTVFDHRVYGSYPAFNYHATLIPDLVASGITVVSTANNHALDRGALGVDRTLALLDQAHLAHTGSRAQTAPAVTDPTQWATIVEARGFRVAWLACAFGTNGIPDRAHQVLNCYSDKAAVLEAVTTLSHTPGIDAVIVTPHVGIEYEDRPRPEVIALDRALIDAGALAVLGAHPHVTQHWEQHTAPDGRQGLIVYSLGNFVSGQFQRVPTRASVLVALTLGRSLDGHTRIVSVGFVPMEMKHQNGIYAVVPIDAHTGTPAIYQRLMDMYTARH